MVLVFALLLVTVPQSEVFSDTLAEVLDARDSVVRDESFFFSGNSWAMASRWDSEPSTWVPWREERCRFTFRSSGQKERVAAYFPDSCLIQWSAFDGEVGTFLSGNPLIPLGLTYATNRSRENVLAESYLPLNFGVQLHGRPFPNLIRTLEWTWLEKAEILGRAVDVIQAVQYRKNRAGGSVSDRLYRVWFDPKDTLLSLKTQVFKAPKAGSFGPEHESEVRTSYGGETFRLWVEWECTDVSWVQGVALPKSGVQTDYFFDRLDEEWRLKTVTRVEFESSVEKPYSPVTFRITPYFGTRTIDRELGFSVLPDRSGPRVVGVTPLQLDLYGRLVSGRFRFPTREDADEFTLEEAIEDLENAQPANCAQLSAYLIMRADSSLADFTIEDVLEAIPYDEKGSTSVAELVAGTNRLGLRLEVMEGDLGFMLEAASGVVIVFEASPTNSQVELGHFWVAFKEGEEWFKIDPPNPPQPLSLTSIPPGHTFLAMSSAFIASEPNVVWRDALRYSLFGIGAIILSLLVYRSSRARECVGGMVLVGLLAFGGASCSPGERPLAAPISESQLEYALPLRLQEDAGPLVFRDVRRGEEFTREVAVVNTTGETFRLDRLEMSCGCLQASLEPDVVEPGAASILSLTISPTLPRNTVSVLAFGAVGPNEVQLGLNLEIQVRSFGDGIVFRPAQLTLNKDGEASGTAVWVSTEQMPPSEFSLDGHALVVGDATSVGVGQVEDGVFWREYELDVYCLDTSAALSRDIERVTLSEATVAGEAARSTVSTLAVDFSRLREARLGAVRSVFLGQVPASGQVISMAEVLRRADLDLEVGSLQFRIERSTLQGFEVARIEGVPSIRLPASKPGPFSVVIVVDEHSLKLKLAGLLIKEPK